MSCRPIRAVASLAAIAAAVLVLAACSSGSGGAPTAAAPASASVTCPAPLTSTPAGSEQSIVSDGVTRTFHVWLPAGYTGTKPVPVVVDYHGTGGNGLSYEQTFSGMGQEAPQRGYLLVAPDALAPEHSGTRWSVPGVSLVPNDVQFTASMLNVLSQKYCVDPTRLYATGFSSGGGMTSYVACAMPIWAAVAPMSAVNLARPCPTLPPMPMITFHGTNDQIVAYHGLPGNAVTTAGNPSAFYVADVQATVDAWAQRNHCQPQRIDTPVVPTVTKRTYTCPPGDDVDLYIIKGTGHTYPGGPPIPAAYVEQAGGQSHAIDAAKVLLDFFDAHHRPTAAVIPTSIDDPLTPTIPATPAGAPATAPAQGGPDSPLPTITVP